MRKIVFALSVVLTVMTACEDNHDSTVNGNRSTVPFSKIQLSEKSTYEAGVPTVTTTQTYSYSQGQFSSLLALIREKEEIIREQDREIGRLEERIRQMTIEKEKHVSDASISGTANVG